MSATRRSVVVVLLVVVAALAVDELGDLLQARGDQMIAGSRSEVVIELDGRDYKHSLDDGARHLVAACAGSMANDVVADPGVEEMAPGVYRFLVEPSLGRNNRVKLVGCLQDFTIDHLLADVVRVERVI